MADPVIFRMPALGADMETGIVARWHVAVGGAVRRGEAFVDVETHKGVIEVEASVDGVVTRLLVEEGAEVPVGTPIAEIGRGVSAVVAPVVAPVPAPVPAPVVAPVPSPVVPVPPPPAPAAAITWIRATPSARHLARAEGIDLASIAGTGHHGAVVREDVERALVPSPAAAPPPPVAPASTGLSPMRQAIAAAMARSNREIPHYYLAHDIDLHHAHHWLAEHNATRSPAERVLPGALLVWAVARVLARFPELNGFWVDGDFRPAAGVHPGIAIALRGGGLVNPALHDADRMTPAEVMVGLGDLVTRARSGKLRGSEVTDATITITSLGDTGVESVFGVIQPPQVALVGFGRVTDRPVAVDGMLAVRPVVTATLAGDHRASDGHQGARFLLAVDRQLQDLA